MKEQIDEETLRLLAKLHREWALRFTKAEKYEAAIDAFSQSLEEDKRDDLRRLLGFCKALLDFTRYFEAEQIATKCLEIEPGNYEAKWVKVETLYKIGEFSKSLVHAYPGFQTHQCRYPFEEAIYRANETIEDCIGKNTLENIFVKLLPWMNKLEEQRNNLIAKLSEEEDEFEGIDHDHAKFKVNDSEFRHEYQIKQFSQMLTKKYLQSMANDKFFFDELLVNFTQHSANKKGSKQLLALVQDYLARLCQITEVRRIQRPLYTSRFKSQVGSVTVQRENQDKQLWRYNIVIEVNFFFTKLHEARIKKDYPRFFMLVDRVKYKLDSYRKGLCPMRKKYLSEVYKMVGRTYIDPRNVTSITNENTRIRYLKHHLGIREGTLPRETDLAWVKSPTYNWEANTRSNSTLKIFRKRLALTSDPLELTWLFHEFSKLHIQMKSFDLARFYAKKSRDYSNEAQNDWWTVNANHLLIRIEVHQHNRNDAKEAALMAFLSARKIGLDYLEDFYKRIIILIGDLNLDMLEGPDNDDISKRQRLILKLMSNEKMKRNMRVLFDQMNFVPAKRRISVMPGCKPIDRQYKIACKRNTILVNPPKDPIKESRRALLRQYAPSRKVLGWMDFDD